jgi:putative Ca2+/H+ antiporter (TMEM165/GDT1 family)
MSIRKAYAVFFAWISGTFTTAAVAVLDGNYAMPGVPESVIYPTIALGCLICALVLCWVKEADNANL